MSMRLPLAVGSIIEAAVSPHPVDRYLELLDPMLTWRDLRAKVIGVEHPTDRTVRLTLRPTRQWKGHIAGQYVQLSVVIDGVRQTRCFSPANDATQTGTVELLVTAHDDGRVSKHLREHTAVGDVLGLSPAAGDFVLPDAPMSAAVFISGGSGITPVLSMLRTLVSSETRIPVTFVHYTRDSSDLAYAAELDDLAARNPWIDLRIHHTRTADGRSDPDGRFRPAHLDEIAGHADADVFVCGPAALMDAVADHHREQVPGARVHSEAFAPPVLPAVTDEDTEGTITFSNSRTAVTNDGRTLLDQAEAAGLSPASGCRMGICFSCVSVKKSGCTRNVLTGDIDNDADCQVQLCISAPVGDVEIEV